MKPPIRISVSMLTSLTVALGPMLAHAAEARPSAAAQGTPSVAQLNEEGAALYSARDYRHAIEKFIQAYAVDADPNLLFNIARCYEELGEVDAAIEKYETFLKTPGADTRGRQRARESLAALREARDQASATPAPAPQASAPAAQQTAPADDAQQGHGAWPWVALGGSVAFAAIGTTFYLLGASDHAQVTDARGYGDESAVADITEREAEDLKSSGDTKKLIGGVGFGLAGALAATYVVLLVTGDEESASEPQVDQQLGFSLAPSTHGAALSVHGSF